VQDSLIGARDGCCRLRRSKAYENESIIYKPHGIYEECNVSQPYADCNRRHNLSPVPNGNDAKHNQEFSGGKGHTVADTNRSKQRLTYVWSLRVKFNDGKYYCREGRQARKRVDPYCPAVGTTAPNDAPFIVKSNSKFPNEESSEGVEEVEERREIVRDDRTVVEIDHPS